MNHDLRKPDLLDGPFAQAAARARAMIGPEPYRFPVKTDEPVQVRLLDQPHELYVMWTRRSPPPARMRYRVPVIVNGERRVWDMSENLYRRIMDAMTRAPVPEPTRWQKFLNVLRRFIPWG